MSLKTASIWLATLALVFAATCARAGDAPNMTGLDFMVDWPKLVGKTVTISDGQVYGASSTVAYLAVPGGFVLLYPPWTNREELRYLFAHCADARSDDDKTTCTMSVTGVVQQPYTPELPELHKVHFVVPTKPDTTQGKLQGNGDCWGDSTRQDISCRALSEEFLWNLRLMKKAQITESMGVSGREFEDQGQIGLHYISNYSRGNEWGSGDVNIKFGKKGEAEVVYASVNPPHNVGKAADFIWNAKLLPEGCSDLPASKLQRCSDIDDAQLLSAMQDSGE